jgi:hypothetical protein
MEKIGLLIWRPLHRSPGHHVDGGSITGSSSASARPGGCACRDTRGPVSNPCSACSAPCRTRKSADISGLPLSSSYLDKAVEASSFVGQGLPNSQTAIRRARCRAGIAARLQRHPRRRLAATGRRSGSAPARPYIVSGRLRAVAWWVHVWVRNQRPQFFRGFWQYLAETEGFEPSIGLYNPITV